MNKPGKIAANGMDSKAISLMRLGQRPGNGGVQKVAVITWYWMRRLQNETEINMHGRTPILAYFESDTAPA